MNDAELLRAALTALAFRERGRLRKLRKHYRPHHPRAETEQLLHVAAECVQVRFGPHDGAGTDPDQLGRFIAEASQAGPGFALPHNLLDLEGVVRGLRGEPDILSHIDPAALRRILTFLVQYLADSSPEIREDFDAVIDRARAEMYRQIIG